jgi:hypothetical protein
MLLLVAASFFIWKSRAQTEQLIRPHRSRRPRSSPRSSRASRAPAGGPAEVARGEALRPRRQDDDGRITRAELLEPRRKGLRQA